MLTVRIRFRFTEPRTALECRGIQALPNTSLCENKQISFMRDFIFLALLYLLDTINSL